MSETKPLPDVLGAVTLGPDDRLVLIVTSPINPEEHQSIQEVVDRVGLTGRVMVGHGMDPIVLRATKAEGSTVGECGNWAPRIWHEATYAKDETGTVPLPALDGPSYSCHLAYGHSGMHSDGTMSWTNAERHQPDTTP